jgi:Anti-sigma-K factor rskA, C-terminal
VPGHVLAVDRREAVDAAAAVPVVRAPIELPRERRPGWSTLTALAIASGLVAIALGAWAIVASQREGGEEGTAALGVRQLDSSVGILADPSADRRQLRGSVGRIVLVSSGNRGVLVLRGLGPAPAGHTYEAWIVPPGSATPVRAGTFDGSERIVPLELEVLPGARVGVTLEASGGVGRPSHPLRLVAERGR